MPAPNRRSSSGHPRVGSKRSGSSRPPAPRAPEPDVDRGGGDVQVLGVRQVGEEREDRQHVDPDEHALEHARRLVAAEQVREQVRDRRPRRRPLVEPERDPRRVPQQQRRSRSSRSAPRIRSASPRWLPSKPLRPRDLADPQRRERRRPARARRTRRRAARTSPGGRATATSSACRRSRSSRSGSSGSSTRKPQKMNACISPGPNRWSSLRCPSTIVSLVAHAARRRRPLRVDRLARRARSRVSSATRAAGEQRAADRERGGRARPRRPRGYAPLAFRISARDRRHDLVQVADHAVVGAREDRRLAVGVDREQLLGALAAGHVLGRAADPARDVDLGRDLRARSGRPGRCAAASRRSSPRASSRPRRRAAPRAPRSPRSPRPSRRRGRRRRRLRRRERDAGARRLRPARRTTTGAVARAASVATLDPIAAGSAATACGATVSSSGEPWTRRLLEQAAAPAHARDRRRVAGRDRSAVRGHRLVEDRGDVREHLVAAVGPGRRSRRRRALGRRLGERPRPGGRRVSRRVDRHRTATSLAERRARTRPPAGRARRPGPRRRRGSPLRALPARAGPRRRPARPPAPLPSTCTCLPEPGGSTSRTISSRGVGPARASSASSGLRLARSRPGTDG